MLCLSLPDLYECPMQKKKKKKKKKKKTKKKKKKKHRNEKAADLGLPMAPGR